jgi:hypothetical protein
MAMAERPVCVDSGQPIALGVGLAGLARVNAADVFS